jgi:plasmid stabilization system protein ParE
MARPVEFHPDAVLEAQSAFAWYRDRNDSAAEAFLAELDRAVQLISESPIRWPIHVHGTRRFLLRRFPFALFTASWVKLFRSWQSRTSAEGLVIGKTGEPIQPIRRLIGPRDLVIILL